MRKVYTLEEVLSIRNINVYDTVCPECDGFGVTLYSSTSTWGGGVAGRMMTSDVCYKCWGSGKSNDPWPSHKEFYRLQKLNKHE